MKLNRLLTSTLCAATVLSACTANNLPDTGSTPPNVIGPNGNIVPSPKGPKPLPGVSLDTGLEDVASQPPMAPVQQNQTAAELAPTPTSGAAASMPLDADDGNRSTSEPRPEATSTPLPSATSDISTVEPAPSPSPQATPAPSSEPSPAPSPSSVQEEQSFFYFSYDDSASTAGVGQTKYALQNGLSVNPSWVRPWEFLSFEEFTPQNPVSTGVFDVAMGLWQHSTPGNENQSDYDLGIHLKGPEITTSERQKLVLTLVVDVSGSMNNATGLSVDDSQGSKSLMEIARIGLKQLPRQLKAGDIVNLVSFSRTTQVLLDSFQYDGDASAYNAAVDQLNANGGTDLNAGLQKAYELANQDYDANAINRVIMLTDAFANQGSVNANVIAQSTRLNDSEGIYFAGLGFGFGFNEAFLNTLTEAGKGTYFSVNTEADARRAFDERFMSLVNIAARNVRFRLDYPAALKRTVSNAEQSSQVATEVDPIHFSYNSSQFFLERFRSDGEASLSSGTFKLTIDFSDPLTGEARSEVRELSLDELRNKELPSIKDARVITLLTDAITGKLTASQARTELDQLLQTHSSPLADEYKGYLESYLGQQPIETQAAQ